MGIQLYGGQKKPSGGESFCSSPRRFGALGTANIETTTIPADGQKKSRDGGKKKTKQEVVDAGDHGDGAKGMEPWVGEET